MSNVCIINGLHMHQIFILELFELHRVQISVQDFVLIDIYFFVLLLWVFEFGRIFELHKMHWIKQNWLTIIQDKSKSCIIIYHKAFCVVKLLFDGKFWYGHTYFSDIKHSNQTVFHAKKPKSTFGCSCKDMCYLPYNANVVLLISEFQQKYVEVKSLRSSGWISNILLKKH